jgi:RNA polymerase sigma factor (sigma-70 family)
MSEPGPTGPAQPFRAGDPDAATVIFAQYARRLAALAEQHLSHRLAGRVDGADVVQSVFRTFFRRSARGEFQIDSSAQLWRLLVTITVRKAQAKARLHTAANRDVRVEAPTGGEELSLLIDREPGPEEGVLLAELTECLLRGLPDWYARLLELRLQGTPVVEIAPALGMSRQTVYRGLDLLQQRLKEHDALAAEKKSDFE